MVKGLGSISSATGLSSKACPRGVHVTRAWCKRRGRTSSSPFSSQSGFQDKALITDVLESTATRRDAKSYLGKFLAGPKSIPNAIDQKLYKPSLNVNLGKLFSPLGQSKGKHADPYSLFEPHMTDAHEQCQTMHLAVVKIRAPHLISNEAMISLGRTITQLATLGMQSIVVVDPNGTAAGNFDGQVSRVVDALHLAEDNDTPERPRAQRIDHLFDVEPAIDMSSPEQVFSRLKTSNTNLLLAPLRRGVVPVLSPLAMTRESNLRTIRVSTNDLIVSLIQDLHGQAIRQSFQADSLPDVPKSTETPIKLMSFDRIIILDPWGGIPSAERAHAPHVYINMKQEYNDIDAQIVAYSDSILDDEAKRIHKENLDLLHAALEILPDSSSGLIVTPEEVARSRRQQQQDSGPQVRTRSKRNPLIHNLLTDKPSISSSLPYGRSSGLGYGGPTSTFLKRGLPLTTIPDVFLQSWSIVPRKDASRSLHHPDVDLSKLVHLIEASFGKELDVERYLSRVEDRFAGLVVAGDYEGCALFTWESSAAAPGLSIPYLDKFAVLPKSQGTGASVADILFTCMIMDCFPEGVCWRSRVSNPVNRWYFERAKGAWKIPGSHWTCFWTTDQPSEEELKAYEDICKSIEPTWPA